MSSGDAAAATPAISVYDDDITPAERARRQKIAENQALMRRSLSSEMETLQAAVQKKRDLEEEAAATKRRTSHKRRALAPELPSEARRRSGRLRGDNSEVVSGLGDSYAEASDGTASTTPTATPTSVQSHADVLDSELGSLMECAAYWAARGVVPQYASNGHYSGWVNPELMGMLGIATSAKQAWEENGGGKFSYAEPGGDGYGKASSKKNRSAAKDFARTMLRKNPNCYFYRHCAPGVAQHMGEWTPEEHALFLETAKKFGCGDKWGLFSTYIPHRVGYQCSNYYRQVVLREGSIVDSTYMMSANGTAVYVGEHDVQPAGEDGAQAVHVPAAPAPVAELDGGAIGKLNSPAVTCEAPVASADEGVTGV